MSCERISFREAANLLPKDSQGNAVHVGTVRRWSVAGVGGVKLWAMKLGGRWYTTSAAIEEFNRRVNGRTEPVSSPRRTGGMSAARRRNIARGLYGSQKKRELLGL